MFLVATGLETPDRRHEYKPPYCLLKLPHKVGDKWGGDKETGEPMTVAGKVEAVKVPAGTFEAIRVDQGPLTSSWYAPGVGLVKYDYNGNKQELKSFTLPKE